MSGASSSGGDGDGSNTGAIVGGVIGGVVAGLLIAGAMWFLTRKRRRDSRMHDQDQPTGTHQGVTPAMARQGSIPHQFDLGMQKYQPQGWHEMEGKRIDPELDGAPRSELI